MSVQRLARVEGDPGQLRGNGDPIGEADEGGPSESSSWKAAGRQIAEPTRKALSQPDANAARVLVNTERGESRERLERTSEPSHTHCDGEVGSSGSPQLDDLGLTMKEWRLVAAD